jgi:UDP-N-acetylglucosamine 4,6-dehydratase
MRSVLVTGASGFFGRGFVRRALDLGAERVCVFSRGEHAQAQMREDFQDVRDLARLRFFIGDVRDLRRLRHAMKGVEVVVHAAALKRVEVGEYDSIEMARTNVDGAINVIEAAADMGVRRVVGLSSDKAYAPVNAYGASKLLAEKLFLAANNAHGKSGPRFSVTRYGNVAGSTGSVIPIWRNAQSKGLAVSLRDPEATRFWMTRDEAVQLVVDTIYSMKGGEIAVPELPAFRLGDLAEAMGLTFKVTGLLQGEKQHESMCDGNSSDKARRMSVAQLRDAIGKL